MKTDIVVLTKAANGLVYKAIESLATYSSGSIDTLIVCYTGDDKEEVKKLDDALSHFPTRSLLLEGEYNFAKLNNKIVREHVKSENVLFMNDDVILKSDALAPNLKLLEDKQIGAVGIKLLYGDGTIQHAGVFAAFGSDGKCRGVGHLHFKQPNRQLPLYAALGVTGAFMLMRRQDFISIGGFDERFKHCFEDVVLCKRIRDKGMAVVCNNCIEAVHFES